MTLVAGLARHNHAQLHPYPERVAVPAELWTIPDGDGFATVAIGDAGTLAALPVEWWRPPAPVVQLGRRPERVAGHARLVAGDYHRDRIEDAQEISRSLLSAIAERSGFVATLVATDRATGRTFSASLWERAEDSDADVADGWFRAQVARFDDIYFGAPQALRGDLLGAREVTGA